MARWAAAAWKEITAKMEQMEKYFTHTGCAMGVAGATASGVLLDDMIKMEGFDDAGMVAYRAGLLLPPGPLPPKSALQILRALNLSFQQFLVILA